MRFLVLIVVSLILAAGVVFFMLGQKRAPVAKVEDGHYVLLSKKDIPAGAFIKTADQFYWLEVDEDKYSDEDKELLLRKETTNLADFEGAVARSFLNKNEPVERSKLVTPKEGGFMSAVLYPGMRAVSVGVNLVSGNAGFIFPGDRVDLLLTHEVTDEEGSNSFATETFIEDIRVLAIDQKVSNPDRQAFIAKTVTLEVTPKQAEAVLVAEELGRISLILRSIGIPDASKDVPAFEKGYTMDDDVSKIITHQKPAANRGSVTITRGRSKENVTVDEGVPEPVRSNLQ